LILRKISEFYASRCKILKLKCTKFDFLCGSASDPTRRPYSALPDRLDVFKGPTYKEREGEIRRGERGQEKGREGKRRGGEGRKGEGQPPPQKKNNLACW